LILLRHGERSLIHRNGWASTVMVSARTTVQPCASRASTLKLCVLSALEAFGVPAICAALDPVCTKDNPAGRLPDTSDQV